MEVEQKDYSELNISAKTANEIYQNLGELVPEQATEFSISGTPFNPSNIALSVIKEGNLPFTPDKFQVETWHALANKLSVILTAPCSSGKMIVASKAVDIMRKVTMVEDGVALGFVPLSFIAEEVQRSNSDDVACVTMAGDVRLDGQQTVNMSDNIDSLVSGKYKLIILHAESATSPEGKRLIDRLESEGKLVFIFVDEIHKSLKLHWGGKFRCDMQSVPAYVRSKAVFPWVPVLAMTATLTREEETEVQEMLCINKKKLVKISASPVQNHTKLINILRPNTFDGVFNLDKTLKTPGTIHLLKCLVLDEFDACAQTNTFSKLKKTIIFVKDVKKDGIPLNDYLILKYKHIPIRQRPWVLNHSEIDAVTTEHLIKSCENDQLRIIITSSNLLMGVNIPGLKTAIMLGPFSMMADLQQALGRVGRRELGGRGLSVLYNCWNLTDLSRNTSPEVVQYCKTNDCLKQYTHEHFTNEKKTFGGSWCCSNCTD